MCALFPQKLHDSNVPLINDGISHKASMPEPELSSNLCAPLRQYQCRGR